MVESATFYRTSKIVFLILPLLSCMFDFSEVKNTVHMLNVFIMHFVDNVTSNFQQNLGPIIVPHYLKVGGDPDPDTAYLPKNQNSLLVQQQNDNIAPGALTGSPGKCKKGGLSVLSII